MIASRPANSTHAADPTRQVKAVAEKMRHFAMARFGDFEGMATRRPYARSARSGPWSAAGSTRRPREKCVKQATGSAAARTTQRRAFPGDQTEAARNQITTIATCRTQEKISMAGLWA